MQRRMGAVVTTHPRVIQCRHSIVADGCDKHVNGACAMPTRVTLLNQACTPLDGRAVTGVPRVSDQWFSVETVDSAGSTDLGRTLWCGEVPGVCWSHARHVMRQHML